MSAVNVARQQHVRHLIDLNPFFFGTERVTLGRHDAAHKAFV